jgi:pimeloyl-ACP methyl ester carboxylesterase
MGLIETVKSRDGTVIAFECLGHGPSLVMVHGSTVDHTRWGTVLDELGTRFSLFLVDRRGRGGSGDGPVYSIEREFEDIVAVLEATPAPAAVLAHSYGAICSLEAARLTSRIAKMVLYEPPLALSGRRSLFAADLADRMNELLAKNDHAGVVEVFLREVLRMGNQEIARLRRSSGWPVYLSVAQTIPREVATAGAYRFFAERFTTVKVPTLFLLGGRSPVALQEATRAAAAAIAGSQIAILPAHGHTAMSTGPSAFVDAIVRFIEGPG